MSALPASLPLALLLSETRFGGSHGPDLTRYVAVCAVLLASIGALAFLFRRLIQKTLRTKAAGRSLQVLDVLPLGGKQRLCVVRCYDRTFALGVADHGVSLVGELDPVIGEQRPAMRPSAADAQAFADALRRAPGVPPARRGARLSSGGLVA
jgi:flagellar biosynthetic protein FliO